MKTRITFSKTGALRYCGHLDLHRMWERTCRRANIPLRYSQGNHPQPKISLGSALPLGFIGLAELVDIQLEKNLDLKEMVEKLQNAAPPGLKITSIEVVDPKLPALQTLIDSAKYLIEFPDPVDADLIESKIKDIVDSESLMRERKGKEYDLRPLIISLSLKPKSKQDNPILSLHLSASPGATGRPEEVLSEVGVKAENTRITRMGLVISDIKKTVKL